MQAAYCDLCSPVAALRSQLLHSLFRPLTMPPTVSIYLRLTDYSGKVLTADGTAIDGKNLDNNSFDATILVTK